MNWTLDASFGSFPPPSQSELKCLAKKTVRPEFFHRHWLWRQAFTNVIAWFLMANFAFQWLAPNIPFLVSDCRVKLQVIKLFYKTCKPEPFMSPMFLCSHLLCKLTSSLWLALPTAGHSSMLIISFSSQPQHLCDHTCCTSEEAWVWSRLHHAIANNIHVWSRMSR